MFRSKEKPPPSFVFPEYGVRAFLRNVGKFIKDYTASHPGRRHLNSHRHEDFKPRWKSLFAKMDDLLFGASLTFIVRIWRYINDQLNSLIRKKNIISYIKAPRLGWVGHVGQMTNKRAVKKLCDLKPICTGLRGRPKIRWKYDIKED